MELLFFFNFLYERWKKLDDEKWKRVLFDVVMLTVACIRVWVAQRDGDVHDEHEKFSNIVNAWLGPLRGGKEEEIIVRRGSWIHHCMI